jgi:hypothetical protein
LLSLSYAFCPDVQPHHAQKQQSQPTMDWNLEPI